MRHESMLAAVVLLALLVAPGAAQDDAGDRFRSVQKAESVHFVDSQGVATDATGFGKLFAIPQLTGLRGDSQVQIPFERIRSLVNGEVVDNRMNVHMTLTSGRTLDVVLEPTEYEAVYGGTADFGYFRIQLMDIKSLTFVREESHGEGLGQRCPKGHLYYNDTWRFCPYEGLALTPIRGEK